jgi:hypothetical protein
MRASQHATLANCYRVFNEKGGRVITLQSQLQVYFPKAIVLAIYADYPATQKITLTGSACPMCFTALNRMGQRRSSFDDEAIYEFVTITHARHICDILYIKCVIWDIFDIKCVSNTTQWLIM